MGITRAKPKKTAPSKLRSVPHLPTLRQHERTPSRLGKRYYRARKNGSTALKRCYCGFACEGVEELKAHILKVHGARDGDWRTWEAE